MWMYKSGRFVVVISHTDAIGLIIYLMHFCSMKSIFTLLFFYIAAIAAAQPKILYYQPSSAQFAAARVSKADLQQDIQYWMQVMEESHVNLYHSISKTNLQKQAARILSTLPDSLSHAAATFAVSELIAMISEGHLGLAANPVSDSIYAWKAERFPYILRDIDSSGFIIEHDLSARSPKLSAGSTIISINGYNAVDLSQKYSRYFGGLSEWKKTNVKDAIRKLLFMDNITSPFSVVAKQGSDTLRFTVLGFTRQQADSINRAIAGARVESQPFTLKFIENNIAVIEFNDMDAHYRQQFAAFLDSSFNLIAQKKVNGLIVDIRNNGGGDSGLGDMLISYFNGKKYRNVSAVKIKISEHARAMAQLRGQEYSLKDNKNGSIYEYKVKNLVTPEKRANRFTGKTAVLISSRTFSSANMLANAIKDYKLATLFGESTAEPGNDFGEVFPFMLPRTHIIATASTKMFVRANGDDKDFEGIKPDVVVKPQPGKGDEVLAAAVKWLSVKN